MNLIKKLYKKLIPDSSSFQFFLWKYRHLIDRSFGKNTINKNDFNHPHRLKTLEIIDKSQPISTLLEIGCGKGYNIFLFSERLKNISFTGVDINSKCIEIAKEYTSMNKISNVVFYAENLSHLNKVPDKNYDIILCDAVLIYVDSKNISSLAYQLQRIAKKKIILIEYFDETSDALGYSLNKCWIRNYSKLFAPYSSFIETTSIKKGSWTENWEKYGKHIEINLS